MTDWLAHFRAPGLGGAPTRGTGWFRAEAGDLARGAFVVAWLAPPGSGQRARFEVFGPPSLIAAAQWYAERVAIDSAGAVYVPTAREAWESLALPAAERGVVLLVEDAFRAVGAEVVKTESR